MPGEAEALRRALRGSNGLTYAQLVSITGLPSTQIGSALSNLIRYGMVSKEMREHKKGSRRWAYVYRLVREPTTERPAGW